ncbi:phage portal protein, partial [Vibrio splendidus]
SITSLDLNKVDWLFHKNELLPLIDMMQELNDVVGQQVITPKEYKRLDAA